MKHATFSVTVLLAISACAVGSTATPDQAPAMSASPTEPGPGGAHAELDAGAATAPTSADDAGFDGGVTRDAATGPADAAVDAQDDDGGSTTCADYAVPATTASCHACGAQPCQANGCYNGYWCNTLTTKCAKKPAACP